MNNLAVFDGLSSVVRKNEICYCWLHRGELVQQIEAMLPNGKPIVIMLDSDGYRVAVGEKNQVVDWSEQPCPSPVSRQGVERIIQEALQ